MQDSKKENTETKTQKTVNERELDILNFWKENNIFEKSITVNGLENTKENKYVFYDGPPFATGLPHYGHVLQSYIKDSVPRYQTMKGKKLRRVWGWDCHGLPLENIVEKELGMQSKADIEKFGLEKFTDTATKMVLQYDKDWIGQVERWGRWVDMKNSYMTMSSTYTESVWWSFAELYKKSLVYEGYKIMHICPRCETSLAHSEVNQPGCYQDVTDISVYVPFELVDEANTFLLAWTTTPWTLPGNTAIAINKNLTYVKAKIEDKFYVIGKDRVQEILKIKNGEVVEEFSGEKLLGKKYKPVFEYFNNEDFLKTLDGINSKKENIWTVWHADFVTADTGTGIAHEAPAFGEDDYNLAIENKIPTILHVKMNGEFIQDVKDFAGKKVKQKGDTQSADIEIIKYLAHNGKLFHKQKIIHSYPHCWRCDTPLLNYATTGWFVAVSMMREKLVNINKNILWVPENVRDGRMGQWLENARDWSISRSRYWGAPLPVWKSESEVFVPSSLQDLQTKTKAKNKYTFIRHGEAFSNLDGIINVEVENDKGLTENGIHQIEEISNKYLSEGNKLDLVISSPYNRTKQTAEIFAKKFNVNVEIDERIQEFQLDETWEGRKWNDLYKETEHKFYTKIRGEKESRYDLSLRVARMIYELEEKYEGKNILIVSHSSPIQAINIYNSGKIYEKSGKGPEWKHFANGEMLELNFKPLPHDGTAAVNFHVPHIDNLKVYDTKGNLMKREGGVFDCWYESGSMPYAQMHFPFENENLFKQNFPADFIAEAQDQTRGWFYSMLVLGVALFDKSPFDSVICTGHIMAADGKKQSKRLKNYTDPSILIEKYSSDAVRYYILSSPVVKGENMNFKDDGVGEVLRKHIMRTLNVLSFYNLYKTENIEGNDLSKNPLDKYILSRLKETRLKVSAGFDKIELDVAFRPVEKFIDDLSVWYLRRSRERLKNSDKEALETLHFVLFEFAKILAPIMPYTAEIIWRDIKNPYDIESVHLAKWTEDTEKTLNVEELHNIEKMDLVREVVTMILDERTKTGNKVRQPLASATIKSVKYDILKNEINLLNEIKDETNIKNIYFVESDNSGKVLELDTNITQDLKLEGLYREVARVVQDKRKEMNFIVSDRVKVVFENSLDEETKQALNKFKADLEKDCGVVEFSFGESFEVVKI